MSRILKVAGTECREIFLATLSTVKPDFKHGTIKDDLNINMRPTINVYELDHRLVERRMRNGFHDVLHGEIKDDLKITMSAEQLFELAQPSCVTRIRPKQPSLFSRIKTSIGKFLRRGLCCVGAREEASMEMIFHPY